MKRIKKLIVVFFNVINGCLNAYRKRYSYSSRIKREVRSRYPNKNCNDLIEKYIKKTGLLVPQHGGLILKDQIDKYVDKFLSLEQKNDNSYINQLINDITKCYLLYSFTVREYFNFELHNKTDKERESYLTLELKDKLILQSLGIKANELYLDLKDKNRFYAKASKWFKRDACKVESVEDFSHFCEFTMKHPIFIAKPSKGSHGWGTQIINMVDYNNDAKRSFDYLMNSQSQWIVEELIQQDQRMKSWNESSVNTLRVPSFQTDKGEFIIFYPYLRMGRKGSIVDNAGSGNPYAGIDAKTGIVNTDGMDEYGMHFTEHPDSKIKFKGFQIPDWEGLRQVCKEIHSTVLKEHKYIGFDFAYSQNGWVVVEANWGTFTAQQSLLGYGIKDEFLKLMES